MSKYYKAEDVQAIFSDENRPLNWTDTEAEVQEQWDFEFYKSEIDSLPTIEIVHCKECKHFTHNKRLKIDWCRRNHTDTNAEGYCSDGKRRKK